MIGGGVFGLWVAKRAVERGLSVALYDANRIGGGASGGVLGALAPHGPDRWNPKKAFQRDALIALEPALRALEGATGRPTGYGRIGRLLPIRTPGFAAQAAERTEGAAAHWRGFAYRALEAGAPALAPLQAAGWIAPEATPLGAVWDTLSARLNPRATLAALADWLRPRARLIEDAPVAAGPDGVVLADGAPIAAGAVVLAAGHRGFALADRLAPAPAPLGAGVKGQAALLRPAALLPDPSPPLIYDDGVYVLPHADGTIAVGATSHRAWDGADDAVDPTDAAFLDRARALCPRLEGAETIAWWAGVRPRSRRREPIIGGLPAPGRIYAALGGYKIGFGVAHRVAEALVAEIMDGAPDPAPPPSWRPEAHYAAA